MKLSPEWLALEEKLGSRPSISGGVSDIRTAYNGLSDALRKQWDEERGPVDPSVAVRTETIPGGLRLRIYTPKEVSEGGRAPVGVYARGGGYVAGDLDTSFEDRLCRYLAQHAPCVIVSVEYRSAPEYQVPAAIYDYLGGYNWAWERAESLGGSRDTCFAIGASCGGGMAIAVALKYFEYDMPGRVAGIVALAPLNIHPYYVPQKFKPLLKSWEENNGGPVVDFDGMMLFHVVSGGTGQMKNTDVFPVLHERLSEIPPTYIATCGADVIRDDGTIVKWELDNAGVPCVHNNYEALPHFFWIFPDIKTGDKFREDAVKGIRFVLEQARLQDSGK